MSHYGFPFLIGAILIVIPLWRILPRLGYNSALSLLFAIPLVGLIFLYIIAFAQAPAPSSGASAAHS
jgi:hypothetical protein